MEQTKKVIINEAEMLKELDDFADRVNYPNLSYRFEVGACNCPVV